MSTVSLTVSLKDRIVRYLMRKHGWVSGLELQKLAIEHAHQTGKTCSRRLQELVEEKKLDVNYDNPKNAASYKIRDGVIIPKTPNQNYIQGQGILKSYEQLQKEGVVQ